MSFAATLGLVALISGGMPKLFAARDDSVVARAAQWGGREFMALMLASLVAGLATTPYAAFHFHRVTPYGMLANLAAMPVVSAVVMPAGLLGLVAMPFGLDGVFWRVMDFGIDWMILVAQWVASLPGAVGRMPAFGTGPLLVATMGMIVLALLRTPLRWTGAALIAAAATWALVTSPPDILIAADGHTVGVRGKDGRLHLMRTGKDAFLTQEWMAADADPRTATDPSLTDGVSCDEAGCIAETRDGTLVALTLRPDAFADDCAKAVLVVARGPPPPGCAAFAVDQNRLRRFGALALRRSKGNFLVEAQKPGGLDRPWSPAPPAEDATPSATDRRTATPSIDATPAPTDLQSDD
jgi:competence protein ComEC